MCKTVLKPHRLMQVGTQYAMPNFRPKAAPTGCRATKNAKKKASAVLRSPGESPASRVKPRHDNDNQQTFIELLLMDSFTSRFCIPNIAFIETVEQKQNLITLADVQDWRRCSLTAEERQQDEVELAQCSLA